MPANRCILNLLAHDTTMVDMLKEYQGLEAADIKACRLFASRLIPC